MGKCNAAEHGSTKDMLYHLTSTVVDPDTGDLITYKDGVEVARNRGTSWMPPFCPADVNDMGIGFCFDSSTGKMMVRDAAGVREL